MDSTYGFSGTEIVDYVVNFVGNQSSDFRTFVEQTLPLAEFRFCKVHDWKFLRKRNRTLTVTSGTDEYALNSSTVGFYIQADDIHQIFNPSTGIFLSKTDLDTLRRKDVEQDDGLATSHITHWAPVGDNEIILYPKTFADTSLKVDGKATPTPLLSMSSYPSVPFRYQDSYMTYVLAIALRRENDDRASEIRAEAMDLIRRDVQDDMGSGASSADSPRFRHMEEALFDGASGDYNPLD